MEKNKSNRITELPDSDFLSFLYSERDREESLNHLQGWNIWAVVGAMVTVACAAYMKEMHHEIKSLTDEFQKFYDEHCKSGR